MPVNRLFQNSGARTVLGLLDAGAAPKGNQHRVGPKTWANFKPLIGISIQTAGPTCEFWANPVNFRLLAQNI